VAQAISVQTVVFQRAILSTFARLTDQNTNDGRCTT